MEDDSVLPDFCNHLDELAGTADFRDPEEGVPAAADPLLAGKADFRDPGEGSAAAADPVLAGTADVDRTMFECGDDDSDDELHWDGCSDNWASAFPPHLDLQIR